MLFARFKGFTLALGTMTVLSGCSLSASLDELLSSGKPQTPVTIETTTPVVNADNEGSYTIGGACGDLAEFNIIAPFTETVTCVGGNWSIVKDLSGQPDGPLKIVTDVKDSLGHPVEFEVIKDTLPPVLTALVLDSGKNYTKNTLIPFAVTHTDGHQVYLTATPGCTAGGTWSLLASTSLVNIGSTEGTQTVYAKVKDLAGNESACVSDSIVLDITPPVLTGLTDDSTPTNSKTWSWGCTDVSSCRYRFVIDQTSGTSPAGAFSGTATATQSSGDGTYYLHVQAEDEAGNLGSIQEVSAVLDHTGPGVTISAPVPLTGNSSKVFVWTVSYSDASMISLIDSQIQISGSATTGCSATVGGTGSLSRTVSVTGCSGNGTVTISLPAGTAQDALGNDSLAAGPSTAATVDNTAPTFILSSAQPTLGVAATVFEWTVTYTGEDQITLADSHITFIGGTGTGTTGCVPSVSTVSASVRKISVTGCSGDGTFRLSIAAGTASNGAGNLAAGFSSAEVISVYNTPVIASFSADVSGTYRKTDTPYLKWWPQPDRGTAPAKYEVAIGTSAGGTDVLPWTDVGLATSYTKTNLNLNYGVTYVASLRLTDTAGKVSAIQTLYFYPSWAGDSSVAYPVGNIYTTAIDTSGRRLVGGAFAHVALQVSTEKYLTRISSYGTFEPLSHSLNGTVKRQVELANYKVLTMGDFTHYGSTLSRGLVRLNQDASLDSSFVVGSGFDYSPVQAVEQSDGKVLLGGGFTNYQGKSANRLIRLNTDGSRDSSFDIATGFNNTVIAVALQPDGKVLVGGLFTTYKGAAANYLVRLNSDGSLDTSLNLGSGLNGSVNSILVLPDGKIIIGGAFKTVNGVSRGLLARLNSDGSLDGSFGAGAGFSSSTSSAIYFDKALLDSNGKIYVLGKYDRYDGQSVSGLVRLNSNGTLDSGFTVGFMVPFGSPLDFDGLQLLIGTDYQAATCLASVIRLTDSGAVDSGFSCNDGSLDSTVVSMMKRKSDGFIWLGGAFLTRRHMIAQRGLARFNTDGTRDSTFVPTFDSATFGGGVKKILLQSDGKILVQGRFTSYGGVSRTGLLRLNTNGTLDTTFSANWWSPYINDMVLRPDQKIYVGGSFDLGVGWGRVALLNTDGTWDNTFGGAGTDKLLNEEVLALALAANGNLLVGGKFNLRGTTATQPLISITSGGILDSNFEWTDLESETEIEVSHISSAVGQEPWIVSSYAGIYSRWNSSTGLYDDMPTRHYRIMKVSSYGGSSAQIFDYMDVQGDTSLYKIDAQSDGKVLIAGQPWFGYQNSVRRYDTNGGPDNTFKADGFNQGVTCLSAESNTSTFLSFWGSVYWHSRDVNNSFMTVISP